MPLPSPKFLLLAAIVATTGCTPTHPAAPSPADTTTTLGLSVQGRPLTLHSFNRTPNSRPVLILAAIHGDEPTTAYCATQLLTLLRSDPSLTDGTPVAILPVANPDGLAAHTRTNARGVDLNRNFPASNWKSVPTSSSPTRPASRYHPGPAPLSEPESQILYHLIATLKPRRICSLHAIGRGRQQNNYDGPARDLAEAMSARNHYPPSPNIGYDTLGSLGSYAGVDLRIPMITLELPSRTPGPQAWSDNRDALLAFIRGR